VKHDSLLETLRAVFYDQDEYELTRLKSGRFLRGQDEYELPAWHCSRWHIAHLVLAMPMSWNPAVGDYLRARGYDFRVGRWKKNYVGLYDEIGVASVVKTRKTCQEVSEALGIPVRRRLRAATTSQGATDEVREVREDPSGPVLGLRRVHRTDRAGRRSDDTAGSCQLARRGDAGDEHGAEIRSGADR